MQRIEPEESSGRGRCCLIVNTLRCHFFIKEMNENYRADFNKRLNASEAAKWQVAKYINNAGVPCSVNPSVMVPPGGDPDRYKDGGDLFMHMRTEVKHNPRADFTCVQTFPFDELIVCNCKSFDGQAVEPRYYFIVNGPMSHAAIIDVRMTKDKWLRKDCTDTRRGHTYEAYYCPKELATWITL